ncbi:MAG: alpha/beta hydrolase [Qipengyuania sp.]|nr:alpha/beta hydrolase [Qipengyuania sp.]
MSHESIWADLIGVEFRQGYLDAEGVRTRYLMSGSEDKPLLLLLHGTGGHAEAYVRNLRAHGEHFWTVAFDAVGHGYSDKPRIEYEIPQYAAHVLAVMKALGRNRALLSGESLGGWIASYIAIHHPGAVERLVLNTTGGWTAHPEVMERIKSLSMRAVEQPDWEFIRKRLELLMHDPAKVNDDLIAARQTIYSQPGYSEVMNDILCLQEMEIRRRNMFTPEDYARVAAPTLVLWTSHDPTANPIEGKQIADMIRGAQFVVMPQCGHWPQFEDPDTFNRIHIDFLLGRPVEPIG